MFLAVKTELAENFNRAIQRLIRPSHLRSESYTDLFCGMIDHPSETYTVLCFPDNFSVPIHAEADGEELAEMLDIFVAGEAITSQEASGILSAIQANAGNSVPLAAFIPTSWSSRVYTEQQLIDGGWLPTPQSGMLAQ